MVHYSWNKWWMYAIIRVLLAVAQRIFICRQADNGSDIFTTCLLSMQHQTTGCQTGSVWNVKQESPLTSHAMASFNWWSWCFMGNNHQIFKLALMVLLSSDNEGSAAAAVPLYFVPPLPLITFSPGTNTTCNKNVMSAYSPIIPRNAKLQSSFICRACLPQK